MNTELFLKPLATTALNPDGVLPKALEEGLIPAANPAAVFFDLSKYQQKLAELAAAFPHPTLNAVAVKANPVIKMLRTAADLGFGAECASFSELLIARKAGFPPERVVFDSPVKTAQELRFALREKIHINADNAQELALICQLVNNGTPFNKDAVGLRINPGLSSRKDGSCFSAEESSNITGMKNSKFGVLLDQAEALLIQNKEFSKILTGLHVHIGSQKSPVEMLIRGIKRVVNLADYLNQYHGYQIRTFDIGGGLPVHYSDADETISFGAFSDILYAEVPLLRKYRVITEFGRAVFANAGWAASRVEYTKTIRSEQDEEIKIALSHIGRNMISRRHDILVLNPDGSCKTTRDALPQTIGGPLCFSGDLIGSNRLLPFIQPGDWVIIQDVGAYTFSEWSFNANRCFPPIYGYDDQLNFSTLHAGQTAEDVACFWDHN